MSIKGSTIVAEATKHIGQREDPAASNRGRFVQVCQHATFLSGTGWPWCAAFVCLVAERCGVPLAYNGAGAHDLADHHQATKQSSSTAQPGDVVDFNIGSGHTGILASLDAHAGTVTTIDGNWGDAVTEHTTPLSEVRGFWRIPGVADAKAPAKRLPSWVVTTSASGHKKVVFRTARKRNLVAWLTGRNLGHLFPNGITVHHRGKE